MDDVLGEDPLLLLVPSHHGRVAERDVVHVEQDLVFALAVPHLATGVTRIQHADGALGPGQAAAVSVALRVMGGQAGDAVGGEPLGDSVDPVPGEELGEDPPYHSGGQLIDRQRVQALAIGGLGRVGMRARVGQRVAIQRSLSCWAHT